ncbi:unnamed protein product [Bemisia tabaci]|uniref:Glutaminyl-peptide cyclotransferase n=2 Tax=Bemisia tabaci TaxID=7038 RepID=A0A9P0C7U7_BEMTA|nr:unnamed protein product [Bemisia tabaci]
MSNSCQAVFVSLLALVSFGHSQFFKEKYEHSPTTLSADGLPALLSNLKISDFKEILKPILVERVPGTKSHAKVKNYITKSMQELGWTVEHDAFNDNTPFGPFNFTNIVAKLNPNAERYLTIAAHYDSKWFSEGSFIGATDSAVPCAMMIHMAKSLQDQLKALDSNKLSLMFVFFDGEEALYQWTPTDSLYGARHLANVWHSSPFPTDSKSTTHLHRIDLLVLLDLIGAANPSFYSYFPNTHKHYQQLVGIEENLTKLNLIHHKNKRVRYFKAKSTSARIEDDHLPFLEKGIRVLHVIPLPFPKGWHTLDDDERQLDFDSITDLTFIFIFFTLDYLHASTTDEISQDKLSDESVVYCGSLFLVAVFLTAHYLRLMWI